MKVSFVIPAYNAQSTILAAVESALGQTRPPVEVVVVDDASTDDTVSLLGQIHDPRLRVVRLPVNVGSGAARNAGFQEAQGEAVACLDADDSADSRRLERQVPLLERNPRVVLVCGATREVEAANHVVSRANVLNGPGAYAWAVMFNNPIASSAATFRKSAVPAAGDRHIRLRLSEDHALWLGMARQGHIDAVKGVVVTRRISDTSLTALHGSELAAESVAAAMEAIAHVTGQTPSEPAYRVLRYGAAPGATTSLVLAQAVTMWCGVFDAVQSKLSSPAQRRSAARESLNELRRLLRAAPEMRGELLRQTIGPRIRVFVATVPSVEFLRVMRTIVQGR